jgi:hypothetical protein
MPNRIPVPNPTPEEESRLLAEAVADLHYVMALVVEGAMELIPGEAVDDFADAWATSQDSMVALVQNLTGLVPNPIITPLTLQQNELTGNVGRIKRSTLSRLKDRFLMFWNSEPHTDEKRTKAAESASDYFEFGSTVVSSIPGYDKVDELLSLGKQLLSTRAKRGI